jgi:hypothetical protein
MPPVLVGSALQEPLPPVLDLLRWCSVHDDLGIARYILRGRGYEFGGSFALSKRHQDQYAPENTVTLPEFRPDVEQCGCCGAWTPDGLRGAVWCPRCNARVCFGRTSRSRFFTCRDSCGLQGQLERVTKIEIAMVPSRYGGFGR